MNVLISTSSFGRASRQPLDVLDAAAVAYALNPYGRTLTAEESIELLSGVEGLIAGTEPLNRAVLSKASSLKVISRCGTGLDSVDLEAANDFGIRVLNTSDAHVDSVAELALGGILSVLRRIALTDRSIRAGSWAKPMGALLREKTLGIIGLGRVGKALVRLVQPFNCNVLAFDLFEDEAFADEYGVHYSPLDDVIGNADIVSLHVPYEPALYHLLDTRRIASMKPGAVLVNCARGGLIDEAALGDAVASGHLSGAFIDTFEQEPYDGPLTGLDNVVLTPHIGAYAVECRVAMELESVENLLRFFRDGSP